MLRYAYMFHRVKLLSIASRVDLETIQPPMQRVHAILSPG
jgi:hypothetical protein